ncbi:MAG: hypothetical protein J0H74_03860 [Chitinophagaceae bacterium]|nr:hypothetical protein [Chitinophagaceae bacterium]
MKKVLYSLPFGLLFLCTSVSAQKANIDSLELVSQISQDQLKLGKLQNMVDQRTRNKQTAAVNAQNSAGDNVRAAEKLNADPDDKKLARNANSKAGDAKSDAGKSRKESRRLDDLNKNIMDLKSKIAVAQAKLSAYYPAPIFIPGTMPIPLVDTTQHP